MTTCGLNHVHLAEVVFVRFLYCKHTLLSPFHDVPLRWKLLCTGRSYAHSPHLDGGVSKFFCRGNLAILHSFIYYTTYWCKYEVMDIYIILYAMIQCYVINFDSQVIPSLDIGSSCSWFLCLLAYSHSCGYHFVLVVFFCFWNSSLLSGTTICFRFIFHIPALVQESGFLPKRLGSFYLENSISNQELL